MSSESDVFTAHVRAFSKLLIKLRAELGNDLDKVLIMSVIAERHYARVAQFDRSGPTLPSVTEPSRASGINTHSVALYTEIPRETVRRKVSLLIDMGWLECDARGNLSPTGQAAGDLAKGTAATLEYLGALGRRDQR